MLIPDSSAKVRSVRIPHWVFGVIGVPLLCIAIVVALFQARVFTLETTLRQSSDALYQVTSENAGLELMIAELVGTVAESTVFAEEHLVDLEQKMDELWEQREFIDDIKMGIIDVFLELERLNIPFAFDEDLFFAHAVGGPRQDNFDDDIAELRAVLTRDAENIQMLAEYAAGISSFFRYRPTGWPTTSRRVTSGFGSRSNPFTGQGAESHSGIDISVPIGTDVFATAYGTVSMAGWSGSGYGYKVVIEHGFGYSTLYAHNSVVLVSEGELVRRGQIIALSGNTGRSTGPHVHYEVRRNDIPRNPEPYLESLGTVHG